MFSRIFGLFMSGQSWQIKINVLILSFCLAMAMTGASLIVTMAALAGQSLAVDKSLATLPIASQFTATMLVTIPASFLMSKLGRRVGFTIGQFIGLFGTALAAYSIFIMSFWLFIIASALIGAHNSFWQYYRFAAAEVAGPEFKAKAISYVLAGGVLAAILGPQIAKWSVDWFSPILFMGGYVAVSVLNIITILVIQMIKMPLTHSETENPKGRPLIEIMRQPVFIGAVVSGMFGYGIMTLVMTATPLAMQFCGYGFSDTATIIQLHAIAMFSPSFITGHLIKRFGVSSIIIVGVILNLICMAVNMAGVTFFDFMVGLIFLGVGWNFMFVGGTTLLTESYKANERSKVQAANDFIVFSTVAFLSFSSGLIQEVLGWFYVNIMILLPMVITLCIIFWLNNSKKQFKIRP